MSNGPGRWLRRIAALGLSHPRSHPIHIKPLVPKQRRDSLDGTEVVVVANREQAAAARERLVYGEVEPRIDQLEARSVEGAAAAADRGAAAGGALEGGVLRARLEQEQVDAPVGCSFE